MADVDVKSSTALSSVDGNAIIVGAASAGASSPAPYTITTLWTYLVSLAAVLYEPLGEVTADNEQTGTSYTLALTDKGKRVRMNNASANTLTVPPNADVAFPTNSRIEVYQWGAGKTTIAPGAGVTIRSADAYTDIRTQYSAIVLDKIAEDEWLLAGDLRP